MCNKFEPNRFMVIAFGKLRPSVRLELVIVFAASRAASVDVSATVPVSKCD